MKYLNKKNNNPKNKLNKISYIKYVMMIFSVLSLNNPSLWDEWIKQNIHTAFNISHRDDLEAESEKHEQIIIQSIEELTLEEFEKHLLIEVNKHRLNNDLPPLKLNRKLCDVAQSHADYMATDNYGHASANGASGTDRIKNSSYNDNKNIFCAWENIAYGQRTIKHVVTDEWMESPWHRANILNSDFKDMGIAIKRGTYTSSWWGKHEGLYFCQVFWALN